MTDVNSSRTPRWMSRKSGMMPMPSGRMRHNSSMEPGRMVGLMLPTTPRQDVKATGYPLIVAKTAEIEVLYGDYSFARPPCCAGLHSGHREAPQTRQKEQMGRYRVTVDTGGTFSDFVYLNEETDEVSVAKL